MLAPDKVSREESWDWDHVVIGTSPTVTTPRPAHRRSESKDAQERGSQQRGLPLTGGRFHIRRQGLCWNAGNTVNTRSLTLSECAGD